MAEQQQKSPVQVAIERRGRTYHPFQVQGFLGFDGKEIHTIEFCVPTKDEEDEAVKRAHAYAKEKCSSDEEARRDPDLLTDAKILDLVYLCTFQPLEPDKTVAPPGMAQLPGTHPKPSSKVRYPAFQADGPKWMRRNLTSDQLAVLHNLLDSCRAKESPLSREIDLERVESLARVCWAARDTDVPEAVLADRSRAYLTQAFTLLAMRYAKAMGWDNPEPDAPVP